MAALSYYSNWDTFYEHEFNPDMSILAQPETQLPNELFINNFGSISDSYYDIDYLYPSNDFLNYSENYNSLLPLEYNHHITPEFEPLQSPKRQKVNDYEQNYAELQPGLTNEIQEYPTEVVIPTLPDFSTTPVYSSGSCETATKPSLSAQSIAARQRRRKISEKTHELGKIIPGGPKMNTAEMFQAAYKYIKYLQAQVGVLEFMTGSYHQEHGGSFRREELCGFLVSPLIQEKLYSMEKCLVPWKLMEKLGTDQQIFESKQLKHADQAQRNQTIVEN